MVKTITIVLACVIGVVAYHFYPSFAIGVIFGFMADKICIHDYKMIDENVTIIDDEGVKNCYVHGCRKCGKVMFERYHQLGE